MSSHQSLKSFRSSPLEPISEDPTYSTGALTSLPAPAYAYASSAKSLHSNSSATHHHSHHSAPKKHSEPKKKKGMTPEERMALLLQFKAEREA